MALYLVDGDNNPCIGTKGAEWLTEADRIIIFYNNSNTHYKLEKERTRELPERAQQKKKSGVFRRLVLGLAGAEA